MLGDKSWFFVFWFLVLGSWFFLGFELTIHTSHSTVSQYSSLSYGNEILWSLSYFSHRYSCMLAPSKTRFGLPEVWSTRAGMRPLAEGEIRQPCLPYTMMPLNGSERTGSFGRSPRYSRIGLAGCCKNIRRLTILTVDFEEPRLLLLVLAELQLVHIVLQAEFLKSDGDLVAIGGCSGRKSAISPSLCRFHVFFSLFSVSSLESVRRKDARWSWS